MTTNAVPLGDGVNIATGINKSLGYLVDCNQATYNIASGSAWHLLYIKAARPSVGETVSASWTFSMESKTVAEVAALVGPNLETTPRFVDVTGTQVRPLVNESPHRPSPTFVSENKVSETLVSAHQVMGAPVALPTNITLEYINNQRWLTLLQEVGVHIYPIAYHRTVGNGTAEIVQCARSDFHFWPMPTVPVWSVMDNIMAIDTGGGCGGGV